MTIDSESPAPGRSVFLKLEAEILPRRSHWAGKGHRTSRRRKSVIPGHIPTAPGQAVGGSFDEGGAIGWNVKGERQAVSDGRTCRHEEIATGLRIGEREEFGQVGMPIGVRIGVGGAFR